MLQNYIIQVEVNTYLLNLYPLFTSGLLTLQGSRTAHRWRILSNGILWESTVGAFGERFDAKLVDGDHKFWVRTLGEGRKVKNRPWGSLALCYCGEQQNRKDHHVMAVPRVGIGAYSGHVGSLLARTESHTKPEMRWAHEKVSVRVVYSQIGRAGRADGQTPARLLVHAPRLT